MSRADNINAALEDMQQAVNRKNFKQGTVKHFAEHDAAFDELPNGALVRRDRRTPLLVVPDGEYGA